MISSWLLWGLEESLHTLTVTKKTFYFRVMLLEQKFLQIRLLLFFFVPPRCCLSHIYFSVTVWGQLGWKLRVGERGSAGFNYKLSKYVMLHVCARVCPVTKIKKIKKRNINENDEWAFENSTFSCLFVSLKDSAHVKGQACLLLSLMSTAWDI